MTETPAEAPLSKKCKPPAAQIDDIWYRVEGSHIGDEVYAGMELEWTSWKCVKTTAKGAWFKCVEWTYNGKLRFALTDGARAISRTKVEALEMLIDRKITQIRILHMNVTSAQDTLDVAKQALESLKPATPTRPR